MSERVTPSIEIVPIGEGKLPQRMSDDAAGYDVCARAVVSRTEMDPDAPHLRKTLFDFKTVPTSASLQEHVVPDPEDPAAWGYLLNPGDHALIGIGFAAALPPNMYYWLTPRSGLSMDLITLANAPGTVDADYRGEAAALLVNRSEKPFVVWRNMRLAQIVFVAILLPEFKVASSVEDLGSTTRGSGGFGSTGLYHTKID